MYRIVVPLDGSRFGEQALSSAVRLAQCAAGELKLVHVLDFLSFVELPKTPDETLLHADAKSAAEEYLEHCREDGMKASDVPTSTTLLEGVSAERIQEASRDWKADLIVMSTHGHGAFDRAWIGSVADAVVRESSTPVVLIRVSEDKQAESA